MLQHFTAPGQRLDQFLFSNRLDKKSQGLYGEKVHRIRLFAGNEDNLGVKILLDITEIFSDIKTCHLCKLDIKDYKIIGDSASHAFNQRFPGAINGDFCRET